MKYVIYICILITVGAFALKYYVGMHTVIHIMNSKRINISDDEIRSAVTYVIRKLLKLR